MPSTMNPMSPPAAPAPVPSGLGTERRMGLLMAAGLVVLPFALQAGGLTMTSAVDCVLLALVGLGLNLLLGTTGLVSFGHAAWFGLGAYKLAIMPQGLCPVSVLLPLAPRLSSPFGSSP